MKINEVSAYYAKTNQSEIFRRAFAGEKFIVTNNGKPQVEIQKATPVQDKINIAIKTLKELQNKQLNSGKGLTHEELRAMTSEGRD